MVVVVPTWNSMAEVPEPHIDQSRSSTEQDTMDAGVAAEDFINTGRTGRRNAIADITDARTSSVSAAGMDFSFDKLSVTDSKMNPPDTNQTNSPSDGQSSDQLPKS